MPQLRNALQAMSNTAAENISAPVDGIAWLLRKAGIPVPQNALMSSDWMRERGLTAPVEQGAGQVLGQTLGLLSPAAVQAAAPQIARGLLAVERNALAPAVVNRGGAAGQRGIFMGDLSKTWNKEAAERAAAMEKAGADPRAIWQETGTFKGADGKWRQEIDDSVAKLREYQFTPQEAFKNAMYKGDVADAESHTRALAMRPYAGMSKRELTEEYSRTGGEIVDAALSGDKAKAMQLVADRSGLDGLLGAMRDRTYGPMSSYLKHGDLGQAYPDVYKMHTRIAGDLGDGTRGQYLRAQPGVGEQIQLASKPTWSGDKSTMLHELQHAIQQRQGFARGGNPSAMRPGDPQVADVIKSLEAAADAAREAGNKAAYKAATDARASLMREDGYGAYKHLAGEAEARAVQSRMNLTPEQRRALFPFDSYDVPVNSLIVR